MEEEAKTQETEYILHNVKDILDKPLLLLEANDKIINEKIDEIAHIIEDNLKPLKEEALEFTEHIDWCQVPAVSFLARYMKYMDEYVWKQDRLIKILTETIKKEREIIETYYQVKEHKEILEEHVDKKENIILIETEAQRKIDNLLEKLKVLVKDHETNYAHMVLQQKLVMPLLERREANSLDKQVLKRYYCNAYNYLKNIEFDKESKKEVHNLYLVAYDIYKEFFDTFPFLMVDREKWAKAED